MSEGEGDGGREKEKKKTNSHLLLLLWSQLPPTPSLQALPQTAIAEAFVGELKLCYCSWHSK